MKKIIAIILAVFMAVLTAACADGGKVQPETAAESEEVFVPGEAVETVEWVNDGETQITDAEFDEYFEGTALEGVEQLLNAGAVSVNGLALPKTEDEMVNYQVNWVNSLYKTQSGWGYNVHKTTSADNLAFDQARLEFIQLISIVRGHTTTLGIDKDGHCVSIDTGSLDCVRLLVIDEFNEYRSLDRGDFELDTKRVRPDANTIQFLTKNFDETVAVGDIAVYWYAADGWHLKKAVSIEGTIAKNDAGAFVINGSDVRVESNISRYNLMDCNRPTQFYTAYTRLGLTDIPVITWCTDTGHPIGFTYAAEARNALKKAVENATAAKEGVVVSPDGADVAAGMKWVTQDDMDTFDAAIAEAAKVANNNLSSAFDLDNGVYVLAAAYGEAGDKPSGFIGAQGEGKAG